MQSKDSITTQSINPVSIEIQIKETLKELSGLLKSDISYIGILQPDDHIKTLIVQSGTLNLAQQTYYIDNSPDKYVIGKKIHLIKKNIAKEYPELTIFFDKKVEAFLGIPLFDSNNKPVGLIAFYFFRHLKSVSLSNRILTIIGQQIAFLLDQLPSSEIIKKNSYFFSNDAEIGYEKIAQCIPDIIMSIDSDLTIKFANKNWMDFTTNQLIGKRFPDVESELKIKDLISDKINNVFINGQSQQFETEISNKSGNLKIFKITLNPYIFENYVKRVLLTFSDITKEKKLETQISKSEERYHNFINFSQEGIFLFELKKKMDLNLDKEEQLKHLIKHLYLSECNFEFAQTYGYQSNTEPQGKSIVEFIGNKERTINSLIGFIENNFTLSDIETFERSYDGMRRTMVNNIFGVIKDNYLIEVWGTQNDITEKNASEKALKESYFKFKTLADYTYDWEYWKGTNNNYIHISPSCQRISGYSQDEYINNNTLFNDIIHKEDKHKWNIHLDLVERKIPCEAPIEIRIITKNGKTKWINHVCRPVYDEHGNHLGTRGTNRDISIQKLSQEALRESEMHFKELADLTFEGILIHKNGVTKNVNKALLEMTGYSVNEFQNQDFINILLPDNEHANLILKYKRKITSPKEVELKRKNGTTIPVEVVTRAISETDPDLRGTSFRDISEQKEIQQRVLKAIIQTEEQERRRIAQELHDGLGPVLSTIKLNTQTFLNSDNKTFKEKLKSQLLSGIDDALNQTSSISNNLSPHVLTDFGLKVAIQKFIEKLTGTGKINIHFEFDYMPKIEKEIEITLYRVSTELINNTIKHAKASNINISIHGNESQIELNYSDNGIGFSLKEAKGKIGGMGLFNIINRIKSLNGKVHFTSYAPKGIIYSIIVPVKTNFS